MKLRILCTDPAHPVNAWLERWLKAQRAAGHDALLLRDRAALDGQGQGDLLFLVSCHQIIDAALRARYRHTLVLHASALPQGRGMSPHVWQILEGARAITVTLLDAVDQLDAGAIWQQRVVEFDGTELHDAIHAKLFDAEIALMDWAVAHIDHATPRAQQGTPSHYRKRTPEDSRIDPTRPLAESFDLLRICDPARYPAFFELRGRRYSLRIEPLD